MIALAIGLFLPTAVIGSVGVKVVTIRHANNAVKVGGGNNVNNNSHNKELESLAVKGLVTCLIFSFAILSVTQMNGGSKQVKANQIVNFILEDLIHPIIGMVIGPVIVIAGNPDIRQHAMEFYGYC